MLSARVNYQEGERIRVVNAQEGMFDSEGRVMPATVPIGERLTRSEYDDPDRFFLWLCLHDGLPLLDAFTRIRNATLC